MIRPRFAFAMAPILVMAAVATSQPVRAQLPLSVDEAVGEVSGWRIAYSKGFAGCFTTATFVDQTTVSIGYGARVKFFIAFTNPAWRSIEPGKTYRLQVSTQGRGRWNGEFLGFDKGGEKGFIIPDLKEQFLVDFAEAGGIVVRTGGQRVAGLSLAGSRAALSAMLACQRDRNERSVADAKAAAAEQKSQPKERRTASSGTGFYVSTGGHILTNHHVVKDCQRLDVARPGQPAERVKLVASDQKNDLALLLGDARPAVLPAFRTRVRLGDGIAVYGFPLSGVLATGGNFTLGNVTALAGLGDDTSQFQISAPVQPGNSGGPLLDKFGNVVGVIVAKLNVLGVARYTNDVAQNVNFAIKASTASAFLETAGLSAPTGELSQELDPADLADRAKEFTVKVMCRDG